MGIYKRNDSKYYWMNFVARGKQINRSTKQTNARQAMRVYVDTLNESRAGRFNFHGSGPVFRDWAATFLESVEHPNTRRRYSSSIRHLEQYLGSIRVGNIETDTIEEFKAMRVERVGAATVNRDLGTLRNILNLAKKRRLITANPVDGVDFLNEHRSRRPPRIMSFETEATVFRSAPAYMKVLLVLLVETGLRVCREALPLRWTDVDLKNRILYVSQSKTVAGTRPMPLSAYCWAALKDWRSANPDSEFVFPSSMHPLRPFRDVRRTWLATLESAGAEGYRLYDLRATFATRLITAGVSEVFVSQLLGHAHRSLLFTYARAVDEHRREAIRKLEILREEHEASSLTAEKGRS